MRVIRTIGVAALAIAMLSCESALEPRSGIKLLVMNSTCDPGPCAAQQVFAYPGVLTYTPGGRWALDLGLMDGPSLCVTIPVSATFRVIGVDRYGRPVDTTSYRWTTAKPLSLGVYPMPDRSPIPSPLTDEFTPATADGWTVTLPAQATVTRTEACTP